MTVVDEKKKIKKEEAEETASVEDTQMHLPKQEYDALVRERDQLKVNLYLLATNLKETGFQVSDLGNTVQKLGNDIAARVRLTAEQLAMIQRQIQQ